MIQFTADHVTVRERESDNSYKVILSTGEYSQEVMAKLVALPKDRNYIVVIKEEDE